MPRRSPHTLILTGEQRRELERRARAYTLPYRDVVLRAQRSDDPTLDGLGGDVGERAWRASSIRPALASKFTRDDLADLMKRLAEKADYNQAA